MATSPPEYIRCKPFTRVESDDEDETESDAKRRLEILRTQELRKQSRIVNIPRKDDKPLNTIPRGDLTAMFTVPKAPNHSSSMFRDLHYSQFDRGLYQTVGFNTMNESESSYDAESIGSYGSVKIGIVYDENLNLLTVSLKQAIDLNAKRQDGHPNPYFRVQLDVPSNQPDVSRPIKEAPQQSKTYKDTSSPIMNDEFYFQSGWGEVLFSLTYLSKAQRLTVNMFKARNLRIESIEGQPAIAVKVSLLGNDEKRIKKKKTSTKKNTRNPQFNEPLTFGIAKSSLCDIILEIEVVHEYGTFGMGCKVLGKMELPLHKCKELWRAIIREEKSQARWYSLDET
ncbi:unnamed protein product [Anisakis simplex]|uniref:C2 domain-containing protein n=1 Tax=Anisakis simplex TaxID=6269 RepID=A0A0M3K116_ANISI|nr:unnamed protein product [Anisakis simplex]